MKIKPEPRKSFAGIRASGYFVIRGVGIGSKDFCLLIGSNSSVEVAR